jgi:hypothetical protein
MTTPNPIPSGDASTPDPIDRIEAFLAAQDGDVTQDADNNDEPAQNAADTTDQPEVGEPGKDSEPQFTTAQLAQFLGIEESMVDVDDEGQPVFKTKIDGKEQPAKFQDFLKDYQLRGHAENRVREAAAKEQALQAREQEAVQAIQAKAQRYDQALEEAGALTTLAEQELLREYQSIDWNALRQQDPSQFAVHQLDFQNRNARIQSTKAELQQRRAQNHQVAQQQMMENMRRTLAEEAKRVPDLIPEWKDPEVWKKEFSSMRDWAVSIGFNPGEVDNIGRAPHIAALRMAWKQATLQKEKPEIEKKLRLAPKIAKPGPTPQNDGNSATLKSLKQTVRNSSGGTSTNALAAYLMASGKA